MDRLQAVMWELFAVSGKGLWVDPSSVVTSLGKCWVSDLKQLCNSWKSVIRPQNPCNIFSLSCLPVFHGSSLRKERPEVLENFSRYLRSDILQKHMIVFRGVFTLLLLLFKVKWDVKLKSFRNILKMLYELLLGAKHYAGLWDTQDLFSRDVQLNEGMTCLNK